MSITITERADSRPRGEGDQKFLVLRYVVEGTDDDAAVLAALADYTPTLFQGMKRTDYQIDPVRFIANNPDACVWDCTVRYGWERRRPDTGDETFSFETTGGTQHLTYNKAGHRRTMWTPNGPASAEDVAKLKGAIGWNGEAAEGVDITVPVYSWSETHYLDDVYVTRSYRRALFELTGKVNMAAFRGFEPGTVLFLGASGSKRGEQDWEITFHFSASPNEWNMQIGNISGIRKGGWEYLWVRERRGAGDIGSTEDIVPDLQYAVVDELYEPGDFSRLGIGVD